MPFNDYHFAPDLVHVRMFKSNSHAFLYDIKLANLPRTVASRTRSDWGFARHGNTPRSCPKDSSNRSY